MTEYADLPEWWAQFTQGGVTGGPGKTWTYTPVDPYTMWNDDLDPQHASHTRIAVFLVAAALVAVLLLRRLR